MTGIPEQTKLLHPSMQQNPGDNITLGKGITVIWIALALTATCLLLGAQMLWAAPHKALQSMPASIAASAPLQPLSQVLCVDDNGGTTGAPCANATAFTLIQDAINVASSGDEIRVAAGTYVTTTGTTVVTLDRAITLTGGYPGGVSGWTAPGDETQTVIDGQGVRDGITVAYFGGGTVVAQNFSVVSGGIVLDVATTLNNNMPVRTRTLSQSTGTIGGSAPITVTNAFTFTSGTQGGSGHTDILLGAQFSIIGPGGMTVQDARAINNYGTASWSGAIPINIFGAASLNNQAGATFTILNNQQMGGGGTFNNFGTIIKSSARDTAFIAPLTFNNSGLVQVQSGRLLVGTGSSTGSFEVSGGATLGQCYSCDTYIFAPESSITGAGTFESGTLSVISGTFTLPDLYVPSGRVNFDSVGANIASTVMTLTVGEGGGAGILGGTRTITVTNLLNWAMGFMSDAGHTDILPGAHFNITNQVALESGRIVNNYGTMTLSGAGNFLLGNGGTSGTFNNRSGGIVNILNDGGIGLSGGLNNFGTITKFGGGGTSVFDYFSGYFSNQGLVDVQSGTLHFQGDVNHVSQTAGTTRMSGGNLQFEYSPFLLQGGTLEGAGTITGSVDNTGGTISPGLGGAGLMTITGDYTQGGGGTLNIELGGLTPISQYDRLAVGGIATLSGTLNTSVINGFVPQNGDSFTVLTYASHSGTYSTIQGGTYTAHYNAGDLTLVVGGPVSTATPSGTVQPANTPTRTPIQTVTATPTACTLTFTDVPPGSTFYPFVRCLACRGIINGYPDGTFKPGNNVTRGQLSKIVANSAGFNDTPSGRQFQDVPVGSTFYVYIYRLVHRGFINGYPCGAPPAGPCVGPDNLPYFLPNANSSRGQISKIVSNAAGFNETPTGQQFQDVPPTGPGSTFYAYIYRLVLHQVMSGYPCGHTPAGQCVPPDNLPYFLPNNNATRGQTSKIVSNTFFPDCDTP